MDFLKNLKKRKGASGAVIGAVVILALAFIVASVSYMMPALADHTATVVLTPQIASCGDLPNMFTVSITNTGGYGIYNVKIYKAQTNIEDITCGPAPSGWDFEGFVSSSYCEYEVIDPYGSDVIDNGETLDFTFQATIDQDNCESIFRISTLDNEGVVTGGASQGVEKNHYKTLKVDCVDPTIEKTVGEPKIAGNGFDWWVTDETLITLTAYDNTTTSPCNLGLDNCSWRVTVDGVAGNWQTVDNDTPNDPIITWEFNFVDDSNHYLEVNCYDNAGNLVTLTENDKVDDTPPETTKVISEPKELVPIEGESPWYVEYVDTATQITLNAVDPDPTGFGCNIGVDKTWYRNEVYAEECRGDCPDPFGYDYCYYPDKYCNAENLQVTTPYDDECKEGCIDQVQVDCEIEVEGYQTPEWYACVEEDVHEICNVNPEWHLYDGTPITKDEESCHIMYYFSVDELGNVEGMQYNCFFVDKTPPELTKDVGEPNLYWSETVDAAKRILDLQYTDGSWDWDVTSQAGPR